MALWSHLQYFVKERLTVGSIYEVRIYYTSAFNILLYNIHTLLQLVLLTNCTNYITSVREILR